ncbi:MAG: hypothetical protein ACRD0W_11005 [Acidimicrobiales bacterium]
MRTHVRCSRDGDYQGWSAGRGILNDAGARRAEHDPVAARADPGPRRVGRHRAGGVDRDDGDGWAGDLVKVDMRRTDYYGFNACWLNAADIKRRQAS